MKASSPYFYVFYSTFFGLVFFSFGDFCLRFLTVKFAARAVLKLILYS